ncbi:MAG TPA: hypothetical protein VM450_08075 [Thermomicrobiales bacterium]|nr:hypothetical protein [Thermomicrobiales bacterium]
METFVVIAAVTLFGVLFGLMAIVPALLEIEQKADYPHNVVHLDSVRPTPHGTDHRPAA